MAKQWRTDPATGLIEVDGEIPTLSEQSARMFDEQVRRWTAFACEAAHDYAVPVNWILGTIYGESAGLPNARSPKNALGLMQLASESARAGLSDDELRDPRTNIRAGARFIQRIYRDGDQLPELASKYNAGAEPTGAPHPSSSSPWGIREESGYIDRVVAGANYARDTFTGDCVVAPFPTKLNPTPPAPSSSAPRPAGAGAGVVQTAGTGTRASALGVAFVAGITYFLLRPKRKGRT